MGFSERLKQARTDAALTQADVSDYFRKRGYSVKPYAISSWETGKHKPGLEQFAVLCDAYKADAEYLLTGRRAKSREPLFLGLNQRGRAHAMGYLDLLRSDPIFTLEEEISKTRTFRLYEIPVSAGTGMYLDGDDYEEMTADGSVPDAADYAVRIRGDSMRPGFYDGQIVFVAKQETLNDGEIGIFSLNGAAYIKKLLGGALVSLNPEFQPIALKESDDFRVFGKVLGSN